MRRQRTECLVCHRTLDFGRELCPLHLGTPCPYCTATTYSHTHWGPQGVVYAYLVTEHTPTTERSAP